MAKNTKSLSQVIPYVHEAPERTPVAETVVDEPKRFGVELSKGCGVFYSFTICSQQGEYIPTLTQPIKFGGQRYPKHTPRLACHVNVFNQETGEIEARGKMDSISDRYGDLTKMEAMYQEHLLGIQADLQAKALAAGTAAPSVGAPTLDASSASIGNVL